MKVFIIRIIVSLVVVSLIVYFIAYGIVTLRNIWTKQLDLKKMLPNPFHFLYFKKEIHLPLPSYELTHTKEKYRQGLRLYGIGWEEDFLLYEFTFMNKSKYAEMEDVRLKFELPGSFIAHKLVSREGVENIAILSNDDYLRKVDLETETIVAIMPYRTNVFTINIGKMHPDSHLKYSLIFANGSGSEDMHGCFSLQFSFLDENGEKVAKEITHPIVVADGGDWIIDKNADVAGKSAHSFSITPIKPISL